MPTSRRDRDATRARRIASGCAPPSTATPARWPGSGGHRDARGRPRGGEWPFGRERFDAVVVTNYLFRPRFALLAALVAPGGLLVYETFARGNERYGKPSNPAFLLAPGELLERCRSAGLRVLAYEHGCSSAAPGSRAARLRGSRGRTQALRPLG